MHVYFSGIGGTAIGPLALIAHQAGYTVSGSDKQDSGYIAYLRKKGLDAIHIGQSTEQIADLHAKNPIDWIVYSSAVPKENPNHPELVFAAQHNIKHTKRDDFLNEILQKTGQKMIAIAGTHGKTTTTAMTIWVMKQLGIPVSYSVGAKISFGDMGHYDPNAKYFVYEADEYDRNFLSFTPHIAIIPGIAYDHPDIYPTESDYNQAFIDFIEQSESTLLWENDAKLIGVKSANGVKVMQKSDYQAIAPKLAGSVNRENAALICRALSSLAPKHQDIMQLSGIMDEFPGVSRRFEKLAPNLFTDYAHTPEKITGALQIAREYIDQHNLGKLIVVYEGLHNTRQHFIKNQLVDLFAPADELHIVPSYRAREDESLEDLTPQKLCGITQHPNQRSPAELNPQLRKVIQENLDQNNLVLCLTAGGGGSLDEWLRQDGF